MENPFCYSLVAYLDVMGTKATMIKQEDKLALLNLLIEFQQVVRQGQFIKSSEGHYQVAPTISTFSDHLVISLPLKRFGNEGMICFGAIMLMGNLISHLFRRVLSAGFLLRGAITVGELAHKVGEKSSIVFGQALIDAYEAESKYAIYPRIILTDECLESFKHSIRDFGPDVRGDKNVPADFFEIPHVQNFAKFNGASNLAALFIDNDGTYCLRVFDAHSNEASDRNILLNYIRDGRGKCKTQYLRKNWIWLENYIERELNFTKEYVIFMANMQQAINGNS